MQKNEKKDLNHSTNTSVLRESVQKIKPNRDELITALDWVMKKYEKAIKGLARR